MDQIHSHQGINQVTHLDLGKIASIRTMGSRILISLPGSKGLLLTSASSRELEAAAAAHAAVAAAASNAVTGEDDGEDFDERPAARVSHEVAETYPETERLVAAWKAFVNCEE